MQASKILVALAVSAGFISASFAQGSAPAVQAAPAVKVAAPAPVAVEKKAEAVKVAEPAKAAVAKAETPKVEAAKPEGKPAKVHKHKKHEKHEKAEMKPEAKPAVVPAPAAK